MAAPSVSLSSESLTARRLASGFVALAGVTYVLIVFGALGPLTWLPGVQRMDLGEQNLLWWGGIRGAVAIALALSLSVDLPNWYLVQSTVYGVALFSLVFQAPLVPWLQRRLPSPPAGQASTVDSG